MSLNISNSTLEADAVVCGTVAFKTAPLATSAISNRRIRFSDFKSDFFRLKRGNSQGSTAGWGWGREEEMKRAWMVLAVALVAYLSGPFVAGMLSYPVPTGPLIYPWQYHRFGHSVGMLVTGKRPMKSPFLERPWMYGMPLKELPMEGIFAPATNNVP
jgi:hypothetical protein